MEAMRWLEYLKTDGKVIVNNFEIGPPNVLTGKVEYPKGIIEEMSEKVPTMAIDATKHAREMGNPKVMNIILLGAIAKSMGLEELPWERIIRENVKEKFIDINIKAFMHGMSLVG